VTRALGPDGEMLLSHISAFSCKDTVPVELYVNLGALAAGAAGTVMLEEIGTFRGQDHMAWLAALGFADGNGTRGSPSPARFRYSTYD
jgi:hypothetical protein